MRTVILSALLMLQATALLASPFNRKDDVICSAGIYQGKHVHLQTENDQDKKGLHVMMWEHGASSRWFEMKYDVRFFGYSPVNESGEQRYLELRGYATMDDGSEYFANAVVDLEDKTKTTTLSMTPPGTNNMGRAEPMPVLITLKNCTIIPGGNRPRPAR